MPPSEADESAQPGAPRFAPGAGRPIAFQPAPPAVKRINRKVVVGCAAVVATVTLLAFGDAFKKVPAPSPAEREGATPAPSPADVVNSMPGSYDGLARVVPKLGPPRPGEFGSAELSSDRHLQAKSGTQFGPQPAAPAQQNSEERELERQRTERIKRAGQAREAGTLFASAAGHSGAGANPGDDALRQRLADLQRLQQAGPNQASGQPAGAAASGRDVENRQDDKGEFQARRRAAEPVLQQPVLEAPAGPLLGAGAIIPGVFLTGINSDLPGQITGQVSQNVYDSLTGMRLLIPQGAFLIGEYDAKVTYGQQRILLVWTRIRLPNGTSISLEGMPGVDLSGYAGVTDQVNNHWMKLATGVLFGSLLGAGTQVTQGGTSVLNPSFAQLAAQGAGQSINQAGQDLTRKNLGVQPTLEIRPGMRFNVFVTKDVGLPVYRP